MSWYELGCALETWFFIILAVCSLSGSMNEVLASLRQGRASLRKVAAPTLSPPSTSVNEQVLAAIRQGVQLKKVHPDGGKKHTSDLERSIRAALERIKKVSSTDSEDSDEQGPVEWDH